MVLWYLCYTQNCINLDFELDLKEVLLKNREFIILCKLMNESSKFSVLVFYLCKNFYTIKKFY